MTLSKETLEEIAELARKATYKPCAMHITNLVARCDSEVVEELIRELLERRERDEQEPVGYIVQDKYERQNEQPGHLSLSHVSKYVSDEDINEHEIACTPLYVAPPAPVVPKFEEWCQRTEQNPAGWVREAMKEAYEGCRAAMHGATISNSADIAIDEKDQVTAPVLPVVRLPPEFISPEHGPVVQLEKLMAALAIHGIKYERRFRGSDQSFGNSEQLKSPEIPDGFRIVSLDALGAACGALQRHAPDCKTLKLLRRYTFGDLSKPDANLAAAPKQESE